MWQSLQPKKHFPLEKCEGLGLPGGLCGKLIFLTRETGEKFQSTYLEPLAIVLRVQTNGEVFIQGNLLNVGKDLEAVASTLQSTTVLPSDPL